MRYIIAASVGTDDVYQSDGTYRPHLPGGAGFYALCGTRLFTRDVIIVGGVGPSYFELHDNWYKRNGVHTEGLIVRCDDSITTIDYRSQDDRTDSPSIGLWEFRKRDPSISEVKRFFDSDTRGIYTFRHYDDNFIGGIRRLKYVHNFNFMWEISEDACTRENVVNIEATFPFVDIFSINRHELCLLYGVDDENKALEKLMNKLSHLAYVRRGKDGAVILNGKDKTYYYAKPCLTRRAIDTTGCGNSSSGAFLFGVSEGYSIEQSAAMGAVAASHVLAQFGPPEIFNNEITDEAKKEALNLYKE